MADRVQRMHFDPLQPVEAKGVAATADIPSRSFEKLEMKILQGRERILEDTTDDDKDAVDPKFIDRILKHYSKNEKFASAASTSLWPEKVSFEFL